MYSIASGPTEGSFPLLSLAQAEAALTNAGGSGGGLGGKLLQKLTGALAGGGGGMMSRSGVQQDATMAEASLLASSLMNQQQQQMGGSAPGSSGQWRMQQTQPMPMMTAADDAEAYSGSVNDGKVPNWN